MAFVQIVADPDEKCAHVTGVEGYDDNFQFQEGISLLEEFPEAAAYRMSDDHPRQIALHDFLPNTEGVLLVGENVRAFLEKEKVKNLEFLPVAILNHKGRKAKEKYFIVNPFPLVDCVDAKKTSFTPNPINKECWINVTNLTIDEKRVPQGFELFHVTHIPGLMLIDEKLAAKMKAAKLRGFEVIPTSQYRD